MQGEKPHAPFLWRLVQILTSQSSASCLPCLLVMPHVSREDCWQTASCLLYALQSPASLTGPCAHLQHEQAEPARNQVTWTGCSKHEADDKTSLQISLAHQGLHTFQASNHINECLLVSGLCLTCIFKFSLHVCQLLITASEGSHDGLQLCCLMPISCLHGVPKDASAFRDWTALPDIQLLSHSHLQFVMLQLKFVCLLAVQLGFMPVLCLFLCPSSLCLLVPGRKRHCDVIFDSVLHILVPYTS